MTLVVTHNYTSTKPNTNDTDRIGSTRWNENHVLTGQMDASQLNASVVQAVANDTNVTGSIASQTLTLGWTGTLDVSRGGLGGSLSATGGTGQYLKQVSVGAAVTVGTIPASDIVSGAALTKIDDTNVTMTLGGTPTTALLKATSLTLGWTGTLSIARGGTGAGTQQAAFDALAPTATRAGDITYWNGTHYVNLAGNNAGTKVLQQDASGVPSWTTAGTGTVTSSGSPASPQIAQWASSSSIQGIPFSQLAAGGPVNKFRNPGCDVDQRLSNATPLTITTSGAYSVDGWIVLPTGASCTAQQVTSGAITANSMNSLQVKGATSVTDIVVKQRIESIIAAPLAGKTVTVQAKIYNNTGGSITPTITVKHANAVDSWGASTTDVSAVSLQACANTSTTTVAYTFSASSSSTNGLEVSIDLGNNFSTTGKTCLLTDWDIRETSGATVGLTSTPPPVELRPFQSELSFCQRYFEYFGGIANYALGIGTINSAVTGYIYIQFFVPMRIAPTITPSGATIITFGAGAGNFNSTAISGTLISTQSCFVQCTLVGATGGQAALGLIPVSTDKVTATAEL